MLEKSSLARAAIKKYKHMFVFVCVRVWLCSYINVLKILHKFLLSNYKMFFFFQPKNRGRMSVFSFLLKMMLK